MKIRDIERKLAIIIKGNPEKMKGMEDIADQYYNDISEYISSQGYTVEFDNGEAYTCPREDAEFWVAHSRGVDRIKCIDPEDQWKFLQFGTLDGIIQPEDERWQKSLDSYESDELPPPEHFMFTDDQKEAIDAIIKNIKSKEHHEDR